jgi:hypothetical protein
MSPKMSSRWFLGPLLGVLVSCGSQKPSPRPIAFVESISRSKEERLKLYDRVDRGDAGAALELAVHFGFAMMDEDAARHWYREAARLGGKREKEIYESFLHAE